MAYISLALGILRETVLTLQSPFHVVTSLGVAHPHHLPCIANTTWTDSNSLTCLLGTFCSKDVISMSRFPRFTMFLVPQTPYSWTGIFAQLFISECFTVGRLVHEDVIQQNTWKTPKYIHGPIRKKQGNLTLTVDTFSSFLICLNIQLKIHIVLFFLKILFQWFLYWLIFQFISSWKFRVTKKIAKSSPCCMYYGVAYPKCLERRMQSFGRMHSFLQLDTENRAWNTGLQKTRTLFSQRFQREAATIGKMDISFW